MLKAECERVDFGSWRPVQIARYRSSFRHPRPPVVTELLAIRAIDSHSLPLVGWPAALAFRRSHHAHSKMAIPQVTTSTKTDFDIKGCQLQL